MADDSGGQRIVRKKVQKPMPDMEIHDAFELWETYDRGQFDIDNEDLLRKVEAAHKLLYCGEPHPDVDTLREAYLERIKRNMPGSTITNAWFVFVHRACGLSTNVTVSVAGRSDSEASSIAEQGSIMSIDGEEDEYGDHKDLKSTKPASAATTRKIFGNDDLMLLVLGHLSIHDLFAVMQVCEAVKHLVNTHTALQTTLFLVESCKSPTDIFFHWKSEFTTLWRVERHEIQGHLAYLAHLNDEEDQAATTRGASTSADLSTTDPTDLTREAQFDPLLLAYPYHVDYVNTSHRQRFAHFCFHDINECEKVNCYNMFLTNPPTTTAYIYTGESDRDQEIESIGGIRFSDVLECINGEATGPFGGTELSEIRLAMPFFQLSELEHQRLTRFGTIVYEEVGDQGALFPSAVTRKLQTFGSNGWLRLGVKYGESAIEDYKEAFEEAIGTRTTTGEDMDGVDMLFGGNADRHNDDYAGYFRNHPPRTVNDSDESDSKLSDWELSDSEPSDAELADVLAGNVEGLV